MYNFVVSLFFCNLLLLVIKLAMVSEQANEFSAFSAGEGWDVQILQSIHWHAVGGIKLIEAATGFAATSQLHLREVDKLVILALQEETTYSSIFQVWAPQD